MVFYWNCCSLVILRKLSCVVCVVVGLHSALPTYNAALNRPAYQSSSVYTDGRGSWNASLANDGNHETNALKDNNKVWCSASNPETNPWWAVDLGRPTTIYRVDLTNRGDGWGMYLFFLEFLKVQRLSRSIHSCTVDVSDIFLSCIRVCHSCADESHPGVCRNAKRAR